MSQETKPKPLTEDQKGRMNVLIATLAFSSSIFAIAIMTTILNMETSLAVMVAGTSGGVAGLLGMLQGRICLDILNKSWSKNS